MVLFGPRRLLSTVCEGILEVSYPATTTAGKGSPMGMDDGIPGGFHHSEGKAHVTPCHIVSQF